MRNPFTSWFNFYNKLSRVLRKRILLSNPHKACTIKGHRKAIGVPGGMRLTPKKTLIILVIILILFIMSYTERTAFLLRFIRRELVTYGGYHIVETIQRGRFCVGYNITKAETDFRADGLESITLAVHTTSNYFSMIYEHINSWGGPISLAIYLDGNTEELASLSIRLHQCNRLVRSKVSFHIVYELEAFQHQCQPMYIPQMNVSCTEMSHIFVERFNGKLLPPFRIYPINLMRNVARRGAPSMIHLVSDMENIFCKGFAEEAAEIVNQYINGVEKNAIVVRRFEVESKARVPRSAKELKGLIQTKKAFEFHHRHFPIGHTIPGLYSWLRESEKAIKEIHLQQLEYRGSSWEPQMILHSNDPMNEENVPTRHRDQQVLGYELCRADYKFYLITHLFNVHRGIKSERTNLDSAIRKHQQKVRAFSLQHFMLRIDAQYGLEQQERCGKFTLD